MTVGVYIYKASIYIAFYIYIRLYIYIYKVLVDVGTGYFVEKVLCANRLCALYVYTRSSARGVRHHPRMCLHARMPREEAAAAPAHTRAVTVRGLSEQRAGVDSEGRSPGQSARLEPADSSRVRVGRASGGRLPRPPAGPRRRCTFARVGDLQFRVGTAGGPAVAATP